MVDAVIVGAGVNGLVTAAMLAEAGRRVVVLERAPAPGGAVQTREATLPGFRHDMGAMNLSLFAGSAFHRRFGRALARRGLSFVPVTECFASAFPDGRWLGVSTDLNLTSARIAGASLADAAAWRRLVAEFPGLAPHLFGVLGSPATAAAFARQGWRVWRQGGADALRRLARLMLASPREFLDETFESERVKALLAVWGMHLDFAPDVAGGALFPYLEGMANQSFGMVLGRGGADCVTAALVGMIEARGGQVRCGVEVEAVRVSGGRATGVQLVGGEVVRAPVVVANVTPGGLLRLLEKGSGDKGFDAAARRFRHGPGTMMLHLAMADLPDWAAGAELKRFAYVHLAPSLRTMAEAYTDAVSGLLPREPVLVVGQPTAWDKSRAPAGKHVLWVQVRQVPGRIRGDAAGRIAARDWAAAKGPMAERVLDILERYAPGIRGKILGQAVVSPTELEAENPNLVGGDQIAGSHHLSQMFLNRPLPGWSDGSTPVEGLWMVGASCWPGGGTGAGSGYMMGERLTKRGLFALRA